MVVTDPDPDGTWNAWRSYQACLQKAPDYGHLLVVQDDALPCPHFAEAARQALAMKNDVIVCFYVGGGGVGIPLQHAANRCASWAPLNRTLWVPLVATAFPAAIVAELLSWAADDSWARKARGDDAVLGKFMRAKGHTAWATVPNLVQHPDLVPSVNRHRNARGLDRNRVAVCWVGDHDARELVW